jgi:ribokinase
MNDHAYDVVGLGQCSLDYIAKADSYPPPDSKCEVSGMVIHGGGPVATALVALTRWGINCNFIGVIGDDSFGETIRQSLHSEGVDSSGLVTRENSASQFAFIVAEPGSGRRTVFWRRPTGQPPSPDEINYETIARCKVFHTDGLFPEAALAASRRAKEAGAHVVVDAGTLREGMLDLARESDYFIASDTFSRALVGADKPVQACEKLIALGPRLAAITLGERGYVAMAGGKIIEKPAYNVEAIDTTGCGDVFHAGFIYGLVNGWADEKSLNFAAWAASRVSLELGGRDGIPQLSDWDEG